MFKPVSHIGVDHWSMLLYAGLCYSVLCCVLPHYDECWPVPRRRLTDPGEEEQQDRIWDKERPALCRLLDSNQSAEVWQTPGSALRVCILYTQTQICTCSQVAMILEKDNDTGHRTDIKSNGQWDRLIRQIDGWVWPSDDNSLHLASTLDLKSCIHSIQRRTCISPLGPWSD